MGGQQEFVIDIAENGDTKVEGMNIEGSECKALSSAIEKALGDATKVVEKPEFHRSRTVPRKVGR